MDYPLNILCERNYLQYMIKCNVMQVGEDGKSIELSPSITATDVASISRRVELMLSKLDETEYKIVWLRYARGYLDREIRQLVSGMPQRKITEAINKMHNILMDRGALRFIVYGDKSNRPTKDAYYLNIADAISLRATCLRKRYGAVIVKNDEIISSGYNGAPRGRCNCTDFGMCVRKSNNIPAGQRYELCRSVHAEANAIISAHRDEMIGSTLYLYGRDADSNEPLAVTEPCSMCKRMIINAGISKVVTRDDSGEILETEVSNWVDDDDSLKLESLL